MCPASCEQFHKPMRKSDSDSTDEDDDDDKAGHQTNYNCITFDDPVCTDVQCNVWAIRGYCEEQKGYEEYMISMCPKACSDLEYLKEQYANLGRDGVVVITGGQLVFKPLCEDGHGQGDHVDSINQNGDSENCQAWFDPECSDLQCA